MYFDQTLRVKKTINFDDIVEDEELEDERFKLSFQPGELDEMLRSKGYMETIRQAMIDYRQRFIPGEKIYGVFMTGGASRMDFLKDLICECWGVEKTQIFRDNDPSLTISEGVAEVARMDLRTDGMDEGLQEAISRLENSDDIYHSFIDIFGNAIFENVSNQVANVINEFGSSGTDYSINHKACQQIFGPLWDTQRLTKSGVEGKMARCEVNRRSRAARYEESPGTAGQGCRLTAGGGDSKDSATEINRRFRAVRMERRGKSSPGSRVTGFRCKPHPVQDAMEASRRPAAFSAIA